MTLELYCDGGVCGPNPSLIGGTWAWVMVGNDKVLNEDSGFIEPDDLGVEKITNNLSELYAALRGIEALPEGFDGKVWTDSIITLYRLTDSLAFKGVPDWLMERVKLARKNRKWCYECVLVGGHPTKRELAQGCRDDGRVVSKWNVWCDTKCKEISKKWSSVSLGDQV